MISIRSQLGEVTLGLSLTVMAGCIHVGAGEIGGSCEEYRYVDDSLYDITSCQTGEWV